MEPKEYNPSEIDSLGEQNYPRRNHSNQKIDPEARESQGNFKKPYSPKDYEHYPNGINNSEKLNTNRI
jgi:hypothetical protein